MSSANTPLRGIVPHSFFRPPSQHTRRRICLCTHTRACVCVRARAPAKMELGELCFVLRALHGSAFQVVRKMYGCKIFEKTKTAFFFFAGLRSLKHCTPYTFSYNSAKVIRTRGHKSQPGAFIITI